MTVEKIIPMLYTREIKETVDFYVQTLGFSSNAYEPGWSWASLQLDSAEIMLAIPPKEVPFEKPLFTGSFYFNVDNADEWYERLKEKAAIYYPIEDFEYSMREFAIKDCNGYILQFGHELS